MAWVIPQIVQTPLGVSSGKGQPPAHLDLAASQRPTGTLKSPRQGMWYGKSALPGREWVAYRQDPELLPCAGKVPPNRGEQYGLTHT